MNTPACHYSPAYYLFMQLIIKSIKLGLFTEAFFLGVFLQVKKRLTSAVS